MHTPLQILILLLCTKGECLQAFLIESRLGSPALKIWSANAKNILIEVFILTTHVTKKQYACMLMCLDFTFAGPKSFCKIHRK